MLVELTKSISTRTIARTLIPKVSVLKKTLSMQHLLWLCERVLDEVNRMIYYNSVIEILAWLLGLLLFFAYPSGLAWIWLHIVHLPRGGYGILIVLKKSPKTYDIIQSISDFDEEEMKEQWTIEKMSYHINNNFKQHLTQELNHTTSFYLIYFILSSVCTFLDFIGLLAYVILFGTSHHVYEVLVMLALWSTFIYSNFSYFLYVGTFIYRVPSKYRKDIYKAFTGRSGALIERLTQAYKRSKASQEENQKLQNEESKL